MTDDIIFLPLHLKLGYIKQFVKRLDKNSEAFLHLKLVFPKLSDAKIKEGTYKEFFTSTFFENKNLHVFQYPDKIIII